MQGWALAWRHQGWSHNGYPRRSNFCPPTPVVATSRGIVPVRGRCSYAPVMPKRLESKSALAAFPQVRALKPTGRGDRI